MVELDDPSLKPAFCRQGNKYQLREKIIPLIPSHKTYVELFAGSGAIFFNKPKVWRNVLNDLDKDTMKRFRLLKKAPLNPDKYRQDLNTIPKLKDFYDNHSDSTADKLLFEKIRTSNGFSGKLVADSDRIYKTFNPNNILPRIHEYHEKMKDTLLLNLDYEEVVKKYDSPTTFFFIDPPYENTMKTIGYAEAADFDFDRLERVLCNIKGTFLMTINDSPRIRKLFKDFIIKSVKVSTAWSKMFENKDPIRKELFIMNYTK